MMATTDQPMYMFQHTAARRRLVFRRPKRCQFICFNTQPPEGGWFSDCFSLSTVDNGFNTQPPEGGCCKTDRTTAYSCVSTHSRPKAAGCFHNSPKNNAYVSTHSRPKAAGF